MMVDCSELNLFEIEREVIAINPNILIKPHLSDIRDLSAIEPLITSILSDFSIVRLWHKATVDALSRFLQLYSCSINFLPTFPVAPVTRIRIL